MIVRLVFWRPLKGDVYGGFEVRGILPRCFNPFVLGIIGINPQLTTISHAGDEVGPDWPHTDVVKRISGETDVCLCVFT